MLLDDGATTEHIRTLRGLKAWLDSLNETQLETQPYVRAGADDEVFFGVLVAPIRLKELEPREGSPEIASSPPSKDPD